jgi:hypothetical protein
MEFLPDSLSMDPIPYKCDEIPKKPWITFSLARIFNQWMVFYPPSELIHYLGKDHIRK